MEKFYSNYLKKEIRQIGRREARKLYDAGKTIFLHPSNMRFDNVWQSPMPANKYRYSESMTFDLLCADYRYYNCDTERGKYIHFFVEF